MSDAYRVGGPSSQFTAWREQQEAAAAVFSALEPDVAEEPMSEPRMFVPKDILPELEQAEDVTERIKAVRANPISQQSPSWRPYIGAALFTQIASATMMFTDNWTSRNP